MNCGLSDPLFISRDHVLNAARITFSDPRPKSVSIDARRSDAAVERYQRSGDSLGQKKSQSFCD
jgi:hypothetical protein